jgi:hypothetical protein
MIEAIRSRRVDATLHHETEKAWLMSVDDIPRKGRMDSESPDQKVSGIGWLMTLEMPERMALERGRTRDQECG